MEMKELRGWKKKKEEIEESDETSAETFFGGREKVKIKIKLNTENTVCPSVNLKITKIEDARFSLDSEDTLPFKQFTVQIRAKWIFNNLLLLGNVE